MRITVLKILGLCALVFSLFPVQIASACLFPNEKATEPVRDLIDRSKSIVVVDVETLRIVGETRVYGIKVVEILKGGAPKSSIITLPLWGPKSKDAALRVFNQSPLSKDYHDQISFWLGRAHAGIINSNCEVLFAPSKGRHLVFDRGKSENVLGFEPINNDGDLWYDTVKKLVSNPEVFGRNMSPQMFVQSFPKVALMACASPRAKIVSVLRGNEVDTNFVPLFGDDTSRDYYCAVPDRKFIALFADPDDRQPYSVPVSGGVVHFGKSYGSVALSKTEVNLAELFAVQ